MMGYQEILDSYRFVTTKAARTLHLGESYGIRKGNPASFVVLAAADYHEALSNNSPVTLSVRKGAVIARTKPAVREVLI